MRQHSVFVYGTLRPGQGNHRRLLAGRTMRELPATAAGLALYGRGIPYAVPQPGAQVVGELITITPELYRDVLTDLDHLEGYYPRRPKASHYIRKARSVVTTNRTPNGGTWLAVHTAWIYLAGPDVDPNTMPRITDDDWLPPADRGPASHHP